MKLIKSYQQAVESINNAIDLLIKNNDIANFTKDMFKALPERFWYKPASSTGKHHPQVSNMRHGLVMHTLSVVKMCQLMLSNPLIKQHIPDNYVDYVYSGALLHDGAKYHIEKYVDWTMYKHPLFMSDFIRKNYKFVDSEVANIIADIVLTHQGAFNFIAHNSKKRLGRFPEFPWENVVSEADYIVSREEVLVNIDDFIVGE